MLEGLLLEKDRQEEKSPNFFDLLGSSMNENNNNNTPTNIVKSERLGRDTKFSSSFNSSYMNDSATNFDAPKTSRSTGTINKISKKSKSKTLSSVVSHKRRKKKNDKPGEMTNNMMSNTHVAYPSWLGMSNSIIDSNVVDVLESEIKYSKINEKLPRTSRRSKSTGSGMTSGSIEPGHLTVSELRDLLSGTSGVGTRLYKNKNNRRGMSQSQSTSKRNKKDSKAPTEFKYTKNKMRSSSLTKSAIKSLFPGLFSISLAI